MTNNRRSLATTEQYRTRVRQLQLSAIERQTPVEIFELTGVHPDSCSLEDLLTEFNLWAKGKSRASWDLYRAAVLWHMRSALDANPTDAARAIYAEMNRLRYQEKTQEQGRASITKPKGIPKTDLNKIIDALLDSNQRGKSVGIKTQCWMLAALSTGLRPNEWESARIDQIAEGKWVLTCDNSKRKVSIPAHMEVEFYKKEYPDLELKNRFDIEAHGFERVQLERKMTRQIELNERDAGWVQNHLSGLHEHIRCGGTFLQYYDACRHALSRACDNAFRGKKRYTLHVMRHQFAANMKNIYSQEEVAELMGHDDIGSAPKDYASRRFGHPEFLSARRSVQPEQAGQITADGAAPTPPGPLAQPGGHAAAAPN